ncbi:hypothetical protein P7F88_25280 [Vibrio hannami]|uniref:hypothetical protein n=1 Tax=Vibrio hannami TaxID=2717094 RepID=UPI00240FA221|nr:hypothetical protein [Vibrio hannami]MDG3089178.1 hypothetical protein [Vibrio hannami]
MSRVSDLDLALDGAIAENVDSSKVLQFPVSKAIKATIKLANDTSKSIENGEAEEGSEANTPLSKTLGITDLEGGRRKAFAGKETSAYINEGGESREVLATSTETNFKESEPPYYKVYVDTIARVQGIPHSVKSFVMELGKFMTYEGSIQLTKSAKGRIAKELGVSEGTIANYLSKATKTGMLINNGGGEFSFHPSVMGRGSWADVKKHRTDLFNHAVGIIRLDHNASDGLTKQRFEFLDVDTAKAVLEVMGADKEVLKRQIELHRKK